MDMFWRKIDEKNFLMVFSDKNPEYICLALRERVSLIRIYNGTYGINSFVYLQHVINSCAFNACNT